MRKMRLVRLLSTAVLVVGAALSAQKAALSADAPAVDVLASYNHGTFLENLTVGQDDAITFTSYFDKSLQRISGNSAAGVFAQLDVHPVGIVQTQQGFVVTAHGKAFTEGSAFTATNVVLTLNAAGKVERRYPAPDALFLNGAAVTPSGDVLIADSLKGVVWRFESATGALTEWLRDPLLAPNPEATGFALGANGVKVHEGFVYVSNTSRQSLYRVGLAASGKPEGALSLYSKTGGIDDFNFASDGTIYVATHQAAVNRVSTSGTVETVLANGCDACTSLAFRGRGAAQRLIVLTTGGWVDPASTLPAKVLSVTLPAR